MIGANRGGETRFKDEFVKAGMRETLDGKIVLTIGCNMKTDDELFSHMSDSELDVTKRKLDALHFAKIDISDEILVLDVEGYIGWSTNNEINHAKLKGKKIRYLSKE